MFAGQQRREQDDHQRPEIGEKAGFGGRRPTQRREIERVIAEQAADPDGHQTGQGCASAPRRPRPAAYARPAEPAEPRKVSAASSNGGTSPDRAVSSASPDHRTIAPNPIRVAESRGRAATDRVTLRPLLAASPDDGKLGEMGRQIAPPTPEQKLIPRVSFVDDGRPIRSDGLPYVNITKLSCSRHPRVSPDAAE